MVDGQVTRVMVGTDRSQTAERAVVWAAGFAERFDAELHVVQVVLPVNPGTTEFGAAETTRAAAAADELQHHVNELAGERGRSHVVVSDDPAMAIVEASEDARIDVLVVGNAGMSGRKEFLLGNVPNRISHNARCHVIIVNTAAEGDVKAQPTRAATRATVLRAGGVEEPTEPHLMARGTKIAAVFAKHGLKELFGRPDQEGATGRHRQAKRMRAALEELGPTFAKLGQILSTRPDLLPPEFIEELALLQDHVPALSEEQVVKVMEEELGVPWEDVFDHIEPQPLAAGTIAEVHRAVLANAEKVVIKVQRPDARELIEQDLALLQLFAQKAGDRQGLKQVIDLEAVFSYLSESLHRELDFRTEARNMDKMREVIAPYERLAVPVFYPDYSTSRLLVMHDVGGTAISDCPEGPVRQEVARQLLESFYKQILVDGFVHADPHPGNLMWQPEEEKLYLLDLGMVGEVGPEMREQLMMLLLAFWQQDVDFLTDVSLMLAGGMGKSDLDIGGFQREIGDLMAKYRTASLKDIQLGPVLQEMTEISLRYEVPLPASLTLTAKAMAQMQLAAAQLDPELDPFDVAGKFLMRTVLKQATHAFDPQTLFYRTQKAKVRFLQVVEAVERLIGARPGQKLEVNFRAASLERTVHVAGRRLALGVVSAAALLGTAIVASSARVAAWVPITLGAIGGAFTLALLVDLIRKRD
ncbi:MAG: ubiquinone biosynthesis protein [Actinomycetota bacterium]|jgi:predicted unusual protein kinase regulating ubiquinone biosynthesis (AarF/ABC1/UbiB family)/nucleotide-binding universal stress UspA family protein|nr:ubiquinone biosynthesis protein [Actinomycetota bacterium]